MLCGTLGGARGTSRFEVEERGCGVGLAGGLNLCLDRDWQRNLWGVGVDTRCELTRLVD